MGRPVKERLEDNTETAAILLTLVGTSPDDDGPKVLPASRVYRRLEMPEHLRRWVALFAEALEKPSQHPRRLDRMRRLARRSDGIQHEAHAFVRGLGEVVGARFAPVAGVVEQRRLETLVDILIAEAKRREDGQAAIERRDDSRPAVGLAPGVLTRAVSEVERRAEARPGLGRPPGVLTRPVSAGAEADLETGRPPGGPRHGVPSPVEEAAPRPKGARSRIMLEKSGLWVSWRDHDETTWALTKARSADEEPGLPAPARLRSGRDLRLQVFANPEADDARAFLDVTDEGREEGLTACVVWARERAPVDLARAFVECFDAGPELRWTVNSPELQRGSARPGREVPRELADALEHPSARALVLERSPYGLETDILPTLVRRPAEAFLFFPLSGPVPERVFAQVLGDETSRLRAVVEELLAQVRHAAGR